MAERYGLKERQLILYSDDIMRSSGYRKLLEAHQSFKDGCNIAIIGASHSGFSVIKMLLDGPERFLKFPELDDARKFEAYKQPALRPNDSIKIFNRGKLKISYNSVEEAQKDGYTDFDEEIDVNFLGLVYPFIGLKEDSVDIIKRMKAGSLPNIHLVQTQETGQLQS